MKIIATLILFIASIICQAQIQYRTSRIKSGKQLSEFRAQRRAGTVFQIFGAAAIAGTAIALKSYKDSKRGTSEGMINIPQYLWPSSGIFVIGCALKIDAKRKLKRK